MKDLYWHPLHGWSRQHSHLDFVKPTGRDTKGILYIYGASDHEITRLDAASFSRVEQSVNLKFDIV